MIDPLDCDHSVVALFTVDATLGQAPTDDAATKTGSNIPAGHDHAEKKCPVCHEKVELFWDDEDDEWMYRCAVRLDDDQVRDSVRVLSIG